MQPTIKEMLDAGVHFGHQTQRWNPKMKPYVFTARGGIHIVDLQKSVVLAKQAAAAVQRIAANGGRMIFIGTKKQAQETIKEAATKCNQFYVTKRWLGGTLTNFSTIKTSIDRLKRIDRMREKGELEFFSKKERGRIEKDYIKLMEHLEGIKDMKEPPAAMFVVDLNKEHIAVAEAKKLGMEVIAIADTNTDPTNVDHFIPGNDDAIRSIKLFSHMVADAYMKGAKDHESKLRSQRDKDDEAAAAARAEEENASTTGEGGPSVVKVRRFVAAGTADEVEIAMELDSEKSKKVEEAATETKEEAATEAKEEKK